MNKKMRIYLETSVISHLDAPDRPDRTEDTLLLWKEVLAGKYDIVVGEPVMAELEKCREPKRTFMMEELKKVRYNWVVETEETEQLAAEYIRVGGLPRKSEVDAQHIALATLAGCDAIVSWNFSHIVNIRAMSTVDAVNRRERLKPLLILSPSILLGGKDL